MSLFMQWGDPDLHYRLAPKIYSTKRGKLVTPAEAIRARRGDLRKGIRASCSLSLADELYSKKIISREAFDACKSVSESDATTRIITLMDAVEATIRQAPLSVFFQFLEVLYNDDNDQLSTTADMLRAAVGTKRPPCCYCGSLNHWFPDVQKLPHQEAERTLSYLELLESFATAQEASDANIEDDLIHIRPALVPQRPSVSSLFRHPESYMRLSDEGENGIQGSKSQDDPEKPGQQGSSRNGGEKHSKNAGGGVPPWMMREVRELFQDKASEQAFKQDLEFFKADRECFVVFIKQLRSRVGKCGEKRDFNSAMLCCNVQC